MIFVFVFMQTIRIRYDIFKNNGKHWEGGYLTVSNVFFFFLQTGCLNCYNTDNVK